MASMSKTAGMYKSFLDLLNLRKDAPPNPAGNEARLRAGNRKNFQEHSRAAHDPGSVSPIRPGAGNTQISVVVPTYNRPDLLERCLRALAAQVFDATRFEIIVVDDGPHQATRDVAEKWINQLKVTGPRVIYIPSEGPHGPAAARNRGWQSASGAVIAFTDDDTIPYRDWLANGLAAFDGNVQAAWGRIVMPFSGTPTDYERDAKGLETAEFVTANCFCLKHVLEELGGFDERFQLAWREDADLYFRLLQADIAIAHVPQAVVEHPIRPARWGVSLSQQKKVQFDALLFKKHRDLYRKKIRARARWDYYAIVIFLLMMVVAPLAGNSWLGLAAGLGWLALTGRFCLQRLRGTILTPSHVMEMMVTSVLIPPLAVFWRLVGVIRFRVGFA
ncbi:cellulose synthase/poly-beta-1,6-N-acetylglucosamine synthase-like glycosyltransferase [Paucimonas lemoignei]|uniref:Cellulose synthase/poly-beta-1,6-N-acetylglucosamine synthase-like glycosyltransferase n=1 Tax=Paucimonas lemoignei TaxID=29443 RepID=A0A4R3HQY5_PAULE|nr:glycosyltransferase [Paucimonas lemoignei]TCS34689.1 cellulose synthase/poly-beta-1,6-N-acetylglucosamine synthase-like glycosyltransferase [Paucimonas lemoignei]